MSVFAGVFGRGLGRSLRAQLLAWLIGPLAALAGFNAWVEYDNARATASLVTDRLLNAAASEIAEQIQAENGRYEALIPPSALGIFASVGHDRALYQVRDPNGALLAGYPDVEPPPRPPTVDQPVYYSARFHGADVRSVAMAAPVVTKDGDKQALVIVGETL